MSAKVGPKVGQEFSNDDIWKTFQCGNQGGMRRSKKTNSLVIISDHTKGYYQDKWDKEAKTFLYTGMGKTGDQQLTYAQNKTLNESNNNGIRVHLFEVFEKNKYVYEGTVKLVKQPYQETQPDFEGHSRKVWIFPLKLIKRKLPTVIPEEVFEQEQKQREKQGRKLTENELLLKLKQTTKQPQKQKTTAERFLRDEYVAEYTKRKANGKCQLCKQNAPFKDAEDVPYLESHHIDWLSKGGKDTIENTVALCPNCHRKMHVLNLEHDKTALHNIAKSYSP